MAPGTHGGPKIAEEMKEPKKIGNMNAPTLAEHTEFFVVILRMLCRHAALGSLWVALLCAGPKGQVVGADIDPVFKGRWPSQPRGNPYRVAVSGRFAYVTDYAGLTVNDVSNPSDPLRLGEYETSELSAVAVSDQYVFLANDQDGFQIIDVSDPANPHRVGGCTVYEADARMPLVQDLAILGNYAFVAGGYWDNQPFVNRDSLVVINVSNPTNPTRVSGFDSSNAGTDVALLGGYAYLAVQDGGFEVIDVSDPANLRRVGVLKTNLAWVLGVVVSGDYAYLADGRNEDGASGFHIVNINNPSNPRLIATLQTDGRARNVALSGNHAYVGIDSGMQLIDVSVATNPRPVASYDTGGFYANDLVVTNGLAYVVDENTGLHFVNITNPANPTRVGGIDGTESVYSIALSGHYAYVANWNSGLTVLDVSNPADIRRVSGYDTGGIATHVAVSGDNAYVFDLRTGLHVLDISDPTNPQRSGMAQAGYFAEQVAISGNYLYVAAGENGLQVIDVSNPAGPQLVAVWVSATFYWVHGVAISGGNVCVSDGRGLHVLEMSDPRNPQQIGSLQGIFGHVATSGKHAYVAAWGDAVAVIDVGDPANPQQVGSLKGGGGHVAVSGKYAYVTTRDSGLTVIDVSNPLNPQLLGGYEGRGWARGIAVSGNHIHLAEDWAGLVILEMPPFMKSISHSNGAVDISWEGWGEAQLQRTTSLANPDWQTLPGSENLNEMALPMRSGSEFFRLVKP